MPRALLTIRGHFLRHAKIRPPISNRGTENNCGDLQCTIVRSKIDKKNRLTVSMEDG